MKLPSRLTVVTATLVVLLPALAVLQYRWVGQLGDAARERMQRNLHNAAQQFRDAFDSEIARAFVSLQADAGLSRELYAERYAAWVSLTPYPWLVANVYIVTAPAGKLQLQRWDPAARVFAPAPWEGPLERARSHFAAELAAFTSAEPRPAARTFREQEDLLLAPLVHFHFGPGGTMQRFSALERVFGFTVIQLNVAAVREQLLPALARRHFSQADDEGYRVAVVDAVNPGKVIYRSASDAPTDPSRADVSVPLFGGHRDPMLFLARGAARDSPDAEEKRRVVVSVIREQRDDRTTTVQSVLNAEGGRWRLLAQHERGSLEAAVGRARQRNLLISFGILLLMGVSIGLLAISSRRAQRLAQQQMEFVAGVSHELRTPVAVIRSAAENLSHGIVGDPERVRRYGDALQSEARRLGEMVERVLHFAGIDSGRLPRSPVAIEPLIAEAVDAALTHHGPGFSVERQIAADLPLVLGDAAALQSAVQNLIANAMKYGGADRWVGVRAELAHYGHNRREVRITVEDHGSGVDPADLPHIFDPFYRGAAATRRQIQGSGLGLALVRRIAQAHGGRVTIVTRAGAGCAFTLHLPDAGSFHDNAVPLRSPNEAAAG